MTQYWDSTKIDALKRCPAYYEYTINGRWRQPNIHLLFGGAFAKALELYYKDDNMYDALRHLLSVKLPPDNQKNTMTLVRSFIWYIDEYASDEVYVLPNGKPAVEVSFEFDVTDDIVFCGHLDKVIVQDDALYIADQKTAKTSLSSWYFSNFELNDQMAMYSLVAKSILGSPIRGVIVDGIQVAVGFTAFQRATVHYPEERLQEWLDDTLWHISQYDGKPHRRWTSCGIFGGCRMRAVCSQIPSLRENYLKAEFTQIEPWQPEKKR